MELTWWESCRCYVVGCWQCPWQWWWVSAHWSSWSVAKVAQSRHCWEQGQCHLVISMTNN